MQKLRNMIGMPVMLNGKKIGRMVQAELTGDLKALRCIWIDAGLKGMRCIPAENLEMIGKKAVAADSAGIRSRCKTGLRVFRALSTDGRRIGAITGAQIDELTFAVESLELSCGFWDDLYRGRRQIRSYTTDPRNGEVILRDSAEKSSEEDEQ